MKGEKSRARIEVLEIIKSLQRPFRADEVAHLSRFATRTVRLVLRGLLADGQVRRYPDLGDTRRWFYVLE